MGRRRAADVKRETLMSEITCKNCNEPKPATEFGVDRSKPNERAIYCKTCNVDKNRKHRANVKAIKRAAIARQQLQLPFEELVLTVRECIRKGEFKSRLKLRQHLRRTDGTVERALAVLLDRGEAKPTKRRDETGDPEWEILRDVA